MRYLLAMLPVLLVLALMIRFKWGTHQAGAAGLAVGVVIGFAWFGLTPQVLWVSQMKGVLLSGFVLAVMWPALWLFHWVDQNQGITAVARLLSEAVPDRGMCLLLMSWCLSGLLEGMAGFGLPVAVVAPMLASLGVAPVRAVAAVAVGHSWAVTFGDMGVILQTLSAVVGIPIADLVPFASLLLGFGCLFCGLSAAWILGELRHWPKVIGLSLVMAGAQYGLATAGLVPLSAFGAGLAGLMAYLAGTKARWGRPAVATAPEGSGHVPGTGPGDSRPLNLSGAGGTTHRPVLLAIGSYGVVMAAMAAVSLIGPLRRPIQELAWTPRFATVTTSQGFQTPAGPGQVFRPFAHPGTLIFLVACGSMALAGRGAAFPQMKRAAQATFRSAGLASVGILLMVGLSTLMEHSGMSFLLAKGLSASLGAVYPLLAPAVGALGAFATGSNNNSNVLFGALQKDVAVLLGIPPVTLVAAQTAGGSLGSMLAPAKIVVGCSTVGQGGREGEVLRLTVLFGLGACLATGLLTLCLARVR
jgi:lactate permease